MIKFWKEKGSFIEEVALFFFRFDKKNMYLAKDYGK